MKVGLAQIRPHLGAMQHNRKLHLRVIEKAKEKQVDLLIFPELSLTGYHLLDLTYEVASSVQDEIVQELVTQASGLDLAFGLVESDSHHFIYNSAIYASQGRILHVHRKVYLPTYGMFDEARYFRAGDTINSFMTPYGKIGILICEDALHVSMPYLLALDGAQIILVMSNSPTRVTSLDGIWPQQMWYQTLKTFALLHGIYIIFVNRVGTEDSFTFYGGSAVIDPFGELEYQAECFVEDLYVATLDLDKVRRARYEQPILSDENLDFTLRELQRIQMKRFRGDQGYGYSG